MAFLLQHHHHHHHHRHRHQPRFFRSSLNLVRWMMGSREDDADALLLEAWEGWCTSRRVDDFLVSEISLDGTLAALPSSPWSEDVAAAGEPLWLPGAEPPPPPSAAEQRAAVAVLLEKILPSQISEGSSKSAAAAAAAAAVEAAAAAEVAAARLEELLGGDDYRTLLEYVLSWGEESAVRKSRDGSSSKRRRLGRGESCDLLCGLCHAVLCDLAPGALRLPRWGRRSAGKLDLWQLRRGCSTWDRAWGRRRSRCSGR